MSIVRKYLKKQDNKLDDTINRTDNGGPIDNNNIQPVNLCWKWRQISKENTYRFN